MVDFFRQENLQKRTPLRGVLCGTFPNYTLFLTNIPFVEFCICFNFGSDGLVYYNKFLLLFCYGSYQENISDRPIAKAKSHDVLSCKWRMRI